MNRMTRGAVAAALAATVALGASAPAVAGPKADHAKATHKTVKATKADKAQASKAERALLKQSTRKQAYLTRLLDSNKLERLEDTAEGAVRKNIEGDIAELKALTTPTTTTPTTPTTTADGTTEPPAGVRDYRPEVYHTIINQLRLATRLQAAVGELPVGTDPATVPSLTELATLATELMTYDALTERSDLRAAQRTLSAALAAIEEAAEPADETETGTEPETGTETGGETGTTA